MLCITSTFTRIRFGSITICKIWYVLFGILWLFYGSAESYIYCLGSEIQAR